MHHMGLLLTMTEPPPAMEEEFNAWYDTEHVPERLAIPGFVAAQRWRRECKPGRGRYLATYELARPEVLESDDYLARVGENFTPWSKRCLKNAVVFRRWACEQILPGSALPESHAKALFLACGEVPEEHEDEFNRWYNEEHVPLLAKVPGVLSARRFRALSGTPKYVALYDLADEGVPQHPQWRAALATEWARRIGGLGEGRDWILACYSRYETPQYPWMKG
jgi:hypothetical protein